MVIYFQSKRNGQVKVSCKVLMERLRIGLFILYLERIMHVTKINCNGLIAIRPLHDTDTRHVVI